MTIRRAPPDLVSQARLEPGITTSASFEWLLQARRRVVLGDGQVAVPEHKGHQVLLGGCALFPLREIGHQPSYLSFGSGRISNDITYVAEAAMNEHA